MSSEDADPVAKFQEFLRFRTVSGDAAAYLAASQWLQDYGLSLGLEVEILTFVEDKPVVLMTWKGAEPHLPSILLNSHYDVVPAMDEHWTVDPWAATKTKDGRIYGRGTQDMKSVCVQYLVAIGRLAARGFAPRRTVLLSFVPDEEIGGKDGMDRLLASERWRALQPVGLALDEGLASPGDAFTVFYGERMPWWLLVKAIGACNTGHGSRFVTNTAMSKLMDVCNKALAFRAEQEAELGHSGGCAHANAKKLGDVTTLNLTMLRGGVSTDGGATFALNVVPTAAEAGFDVRISPRMPPGEFRALINGWCREEGVKWDFAPWTSPMSEHYLTSLDRDENPWWGVFLDTMQRLGAEVEPEIFPAGTDSRFIRALGIPALGFSPLKWTPILLHDHNEYVDESVFLAGIGVYEELIAALAAADRFPGEK
ncbi:unnamed protein product [Phaeothamnion confervicola]